MWIEIFMLSAIFAGRPVILRMKDVDWNMTKSEDGGRVHVILRMKDVDWNWKDDALVASEIVILRMKDVDWNVPASTRL